ncbi:hypothetical protein LINGRAHAP2_LOCUS34260 [Linum grandiflorum]
MACVSSASCALFSSVNNTLIIFYSSDYHSHILWLFNSVPAAVNIGIQLLLARRSNGGLLAFSMAGPFMVIQNHCRCTSCCYVHLCFKRLTLNINLESWSTAIIGAYF